MNDNDVREIVLEKLYKMADSENEHDLLSTYFELKAILSDYKQRIKLDLKYGKETPENDN